MEPLTVGINEAAKLLGISPWTLRNYERRKLIKAVRVGSRVLIPTEEMKRIVQEGISLNQISHAGGG